VDVHSVYAGVGGITDRIFILCLNGSGELPTKYSFGVCSNPADCRPNIHWVYVGSGGYQLDI
jgi:hypothetical protein